jgi:S1-C subfamily serine protease
LAFTFRTASQKSGKNFEKTLFIIIKRGRLMTETETPQYPVTSKRSYASVAILILLIVNTAIFAVAFLNLQNQLTNMETTIAKQNTEIQDLQNHIEILDAIDQTGTVPWPTIYDQLKDSVVLIQTDVGLGSGFVYDSNGHIITNYHVIEDSDTIQVTFLDGTIASATLIGSDIYSDIAVVKVDSQVTTLHPVVLGFSSDLDVGEPVAAMGNPYGLSDTLTAGIVSAIERNLDATGNYVIIDIIQLDAAINPGNSGGPLVNMQGQVVGVNTAIQSETGSFAGIGFAIPSDTVKREIDDLIATGTYKHPYLGISGLDVNLPIAEAIGLDTPQGFLVIDVTAGSPAEQAGIQGSDHDEVVDGQTVPLGGDVIVEIDGLPVRTLTDAVVYMERNKQPGDTVDLVLIRDLQEQSLTATLGERPPL